MSACVYLWISSGINGCDVVEHFLQCFYNCTVYNDISLQCFDTVGWATGRASGL